MISFFGPRSRHQHHHITQRKLNVPSESYLSAGDTYPEVSLMGSFHFWCLENTPHKALDAFRGT